MDALAATALDEIVPQAQQRSTADTIAQSDAAAQVAGPGGRGDPVGQPATVAVDAAVGVTAAAGGGDDREDPASDFVPQRLWRWQATRNAAYNKLIERIEHVAIASRAPILLMGPTGAGKSQLARKIYDLKKGRRQVSGDFLDLNCATIEGRRRSGTPDRAGAE
ncbi:sigma 54-interacting transcriptional regulator [Sorangium sp. So ce429]